MNDCIWQVLSAVVFVCDCHCCCCLVGREEGCSLLWGDTVTASVLPHLIPSHSCPTGCQLPGRSPSAFTLSSLLVQWQVMGDKREEKQIDCRLDGVSTVSGELNCLHTTAFIVST